MKNVLVDLLLGAGFTERPVPEKDALRTAECDGILLEREWQRQTELLWHGPWVETYRVRVFVNRRSEICEATFYKNTVPYKNKWYDTTGRRTFNAIRETARCAGWEL